VPPATSPYVLEVGKRITTSLKESFSSRGVHG
jgi:hypothetical protein